MLLSSVTSSEWANTRPPSFLIVCATSVRRDSRRAPIATCTPRRASSNAVAAPMPDDAPVMIAVFPCDSAISQLDGQRGEAAHADGVDARAAFRLDLVVGEALPELLEDDPALEARQRGAETEMRAMTEREHGLSVSLEV